MPSRRLSFSDLPLELFRAILVEAVRVRCIKRALRLRLVCKLFSEEITEALSASGLYSDCDVYLDKMPFVRTALTRRLLEHRTSGLMTLNTVHKAAERLVIENGEPEKFQGYALSLLQLVSSAGTSKVCQLLLPGRGYWEPEGFEYELLTAAAYTNNISLVRKLAKPHLASKCGVFGNPYVAALLGRSFDVLNSFFEEDQSLNARELDDLVALAAYNGDKEMVEFIYRAEWSPSHPRYKSDKGRWGPDRLHPKKMLRTPSPEIFNIIMRERELTNADLIPNLLNFLLRNAAIRGWANMIRHIFSLEGTPEPPMSFGLTAEAKGLWPLYCACEAGQDEVVRLLLPYQVQPLGFELETAASHGNISTLKLLLEYGADINLKLAKNCVIAAAAKGYLGIVRMLLDAGMDPNEGDIVPLVHAVRAENPDICQLLMERGATLSLNDAIAEASKANNLHNEPKFIDRGTGSYIKWIMVRSSMWAHPPRRITIESSFIEF